MKYIPTIIIFVILLLSVAVNASCEITGNELSEAVNAYNNPQKNLTYQAGHFVGFVHGIADETCGSQWCAPNTTVTYGQILGIVSKYFKNHPELWHMPAHDLVINALKEAFPCKH